MFICMFQLFFARNFYTQSHAAGVRVNFLIDRYYFPRERCCPSVSLLFPIHCPSFSLSPLRCIYPSLIVSSYLPQFSSSILVKDKNATPPSRGQGKKALKARQKYRVITCLTLSPVFLRSSDLTALRWTCPKSGWRTQRTSRSSCSPPSAMLVRNAKPVSYLPRVHSSERS